MTRRKFIAGLGSVAVWPRGARAQGPAMPVIGVLEFGAPGRTRSDLSAFRQGLADAGIIDGKNALVKVRWANFQSQRLGTLAADLVNEKSAVIVVTGHANAVRAAKAATSTIPIVFKIAVDPVATFLVDSLSRPGGNVTGITTLSIALAAKRLDLLRELAPQATTIAYLGDDDGMETSDILAAAQQLRRQVVVLPVRSDGDVDGAFATIAERQIGALVVADSPSVYRLTDKILELANLHRLPAVYPDATYVFRGGLISYADNGADEWRRLGAQYVAPILKGKRTTDLPVQQPTKFRLLVNLKAAKALGLTIPETLLATADEVIQ
jgi:putative tryptophan/tyrosine transport system substrate-binding protein